MSSLRLKGTEFPTLLPDSLTGFEVTLRGPTSKGRGGNGREGKEGNGKKEEKEERGERKEGVDWTPLQFMTVNGDTEHQQFYSDF